VLCGALVLAGCTGGGHRGPVRLAAGPARAAYDTPVRIRMTGLGDGERVTLRASTRDARNRSWASTATFVAGGDGVVDLARAKPVAGSYRVADAAGPLWSLLPTFSRDPTVQFVPPQPSFTVALAASTGGKVRARASLVRTDQAASTTLTVASNGLAGALFTPPQPKPGVPAVLVIGGSEGGEPTSQARALALVGYPAFALGYFAEPGLPACLCSILLEYFAKAVAWLRAQPAARGRPVVLMGTSRGGEGALLITSTLPHLVDGVVANSPSSIVMGAYGPGAMSTMPAWTYAGQPVPNESIPIGRITVPLLTSYGGKDQVWDSADAVSIVMSELASAHDPAPHTALSYPDAGHSAVGSPPYLPHPAWARPAGSSPNQLGGTVTANAQAAERFWARLLAFLDAVR
jgi:dienelactone hydrolase